MIVWHNFKKKVFYEGHYYTYKSFSSPNQPDTVVYNRNNDDGVVLDTLENIQFLRTDWVNNCPISLTSPIGKIMESIIKDNIQEHLKANHIIPLQKHGFTVRRSSALILGVHGV